MAIYKEIVSKTVIGKGKKNFRNTYVVEAESTPTTILGCWVINHKFDGKKLENNILVTGSFDVNIWYSHENDSKTGVFTKTIDYTETVSVKQKMETDSDNTNVIIRALKNPTCSKVEITSGDKISFIIDKELGIELVGDAKIKILVEEDEEPWDLLNDDDEIEKAIDENVNTDFLEEK